MSKLPWMKFYPDKWLADERLRACGFAAKGLWADIIALSCKNDRRGYLQLNDAPISPEQLARMTGGSADEVSRLLQELISAGVPSVTPEGIMFCRHIVRDTEKSDKCSVAGRKGGGNPKLATFKGETPETFKGHPKRPPKGTPKQTSLLLPLTSVLLENKDFTEAFTRFQNYRARKPRPPSNDGYQLMLKRFEPFGASICIEAMNMSMESGWLGVFPERIQQQRAAIGGKPKTRSVASSPDAMEAWAARGGSMADTGERIEEAKEFVRKQTGGNEVPT